MAAIPVCFNPRAHVGRDREPCVALLFGLGFNPRAHVGRDLAALVAYGRCLVSIHAPTWGATGVAIALNDR